MIPIQYNLRSLAARKTTTLMTAGGVGLVVFAVAAAMMLVAGVKKTLVTTGGPDVAIVMRKGSDNELSSTIEDSSVGLIRALPGIKQSGGAAQVVGEVIIVNAMEKMGVAGVTNVTLRGIPDKGFDFRPNLKIIAGRALKPGSDEVMVGARIRGRFKGMDLEQTFEIKKGRAVKVVGIFEDAGSSYESEVFADVDTIRSAYGREGMVSSVRVRLESEGRFDAFQAAVESDKRLGLQAQREPAYYEKLSEGTSLFIGAIGLLISVFGAMGAIIGAMITMYAAVAHRQREIGTLRALGFSRLSILTSFLIESIVLALAGGVIGTIAALGLGTVKISIMNFSSWSECVFRFEPTPQVLVSAFVLAGGMGLIGGFLPALRASRVSPILAMRGG